MYVYMNDIKTDVMISEILTIYVKCGLNKYVISVCIIIQYQYS